MPSTEELLAESEASNAKLQKTIDDLYKTTMGLQLLTTQMRWECARLRTLRLRVAAGELTDQVDLHRELGTQKEFVSATIDY
jgi:hypothetical protein